jgi:hypothetical protein
MPLLSYFVVVGSALIGLLYLANAVLPRDTPIRSSNIEAASQPQRQPQHAPALSSSSPRPAMSFAAVPVAAPAHVEEPTQKLNAPPASVTQNAAPQKKRKPIPRKREWRDDFTQANSWSRDDRWTDRRRRNDGRRDPGWRGPVWGSNWRGPGWRW